MNILDVRETAISKVYLTKDYAYKVKKPVKLSFLDYSTLDLRKQACQAEIDLNSRLSPGIYFEVQPFFYNNEFDWAVKMVRLNDLDRADSKLGSFHKSSLVVIGSNAKESLLNDINSIANYSKSLGFDLNKINNIKYKFIKWVNDNEILLESRLSEGFHRQGHGDLRMDHVYFDKDKIHVLDGTEFSTAFRHIDIAKDIAGIVLDLKINGEFKLADILLDSWSKETNDLAANYLIDFYTHYRAQICANALKARGEEVLAIKYISYAEDL